MTETSPAYAQVKQTSALKREYPTLIEKEPGKAKVKLLDGREEWFEVSKDVEDIKNKIPDSSSVFMSFYEPTRGKFAISGIYQVDQSGNRVHHAVQETVPANPAPSPQQKPPMKRQFPTLVSKSAGKAQIRSIKGDVDWYNVVADFEDLKSRIPDGSLVSVTFSDMSTISKIWHVDENGTLIKHPKTGWSGGGRKVDPALEREKAEQIIYQTALKAAESFVSNIITVDSIHISTEDVAKWWEVVLMCTDTGAQHIIKNTRGDPK
jgi:hypothetical protein